MDFLNVWVKQLLCENYPCLFTFSSPFKFRPRKCQKNRFAKSWSRLEWSFFLLEFVFLEHGDEWMWMDGIYAIILSNLSLSETIFYETSKMFIETWRCTDLQHFSSAKSDINLSWKSTVISKDLAYFRNQKNLIDKEMLEVNTIILGLKALFIFRSGRLEVINRNAWSNWILQPEEMTT